VLAATVNLSSRPLPVSGPPATGAGGAAAGAVPGLSPVPNAIAPKTSACRDDTGLPAPTIFMVHCAVAFDGA
jgi:hypothetical protein